MPPTPAASSPNEPTTSQSDGSSDETDTGSRTTSTTSWTRTLQQVDLARLSPSSQAVRILIGENIPDGYPLTELAEKLGRPPSWVSERLASLRNELLLQSGLFFPLTDSEYDALRASIRRHGIRTPILIGEHTTLIDGRHRLLIAEELGLNDCPAIFLTGLSAEAERELAIGLNAARRQLTRAQKRTLIEAELMRDPARSDRLIASICGATHPTVADVRRELTHAQTPQEAPSEPARVSEPVTTRSDQQAPHSVTQSAPAVDYDPPGRIDRRGSLQTVRTNTTELGRPATPLAYLTCTHGEMHALYKDSHGYRLTASRD